MHYERYYLLAPKAINAYAARVWNCDPYVVYLYGPRRPMVSDTPHKVTLSASHTLTRSVQLSSSVRSTAVGFGHWRLHGVRRMGHGAICCLLCLCAALRARPLWRALHPATPLHKVNAQGHNVLVACANAATSARRATRRRSATTGGGLRLVLV